LQESLVNEQSGGWTPAVVPAPNNLWQDPRPESPGVEKDYPHTAQRADDT